MKTAKLYSIGLVAVMIVTFSRPNFAQIVDFYSSPGYSALIRNLVGNSIWNSSMQHYTKNYKRSSGASTSSSSSRPPSPPPAYDPCYLSVLCSNKYPAVQFKSTGTRPTLEEQLAAFEGTPQERAEMRKLTLE